MKLMATGPDGTWHLAPGTLFILSSCPNETRMEHELPTG
jgi:hypothetical protein